MPSAVGLPADIAPATSRSTNTSAAMKNRPFIGRFEILSTLGQGAEGAVYLANDSRLGRRVAVKTVLPHPTGGAGGATSANAANTANIATLLDEARTVSALSHPNIVPLYDAGEEGGAPYLVFEYVEGKTLATLIQEQGRLEVGRAVKIAVGLAQGVAYAHATSFGLMTLGVCLAVYGFYYASTEGVLTAMASAAVLADIRASGLAVLGTASGIGKLLSSLMFGWIWEYYGIRAPIEAFIVGLVLAMGIGVFLLARSGAPDGNVAP